MTFEEQMKEYSNNLKEISTILDTMAALSFQEASLAKTMAKKVEATNNIPSVESDIRSLAMKMQLGRTMCDLMLRINVWATTADTNSSVFLDVSKIIKETANAMEVSE